RANGAGLETVSVPDNVAEMPEAEYRADLVRRALQLMQAQFAEADWKACWQNVVEGRPVAEVAEELGLTVNQVYLAKSRILHWLGREWGGLVDGGFVGVAPAGRANPPACRAAPDAFGPARQAGPEIF